MKERQWQTENGWKGKKITSKKKRKEKKRSNISFRSDALCACYDECECIICIGLHPSFGFLVLHLILLQKINFFSNMIDSNGNGNQSPLLLYAWKWEKFTYNTIISMSFHHFLSLPFVHSLSISFYVDVFSFFLSSSINNNNKIKKEDAEQPEIQSIDIIWRLLLSLSLCV